MHITIVSLLGEMTNGKKLPPITMLTATNTLLLEYNLFL